MFRNSVVAATLAVVACMATATSAFAAEDWSTHVPQQNANVILRTGTGGAPKKGNPLVVNAYLSTRDPLSAKTVHQPQAVATVRMKFPKHTVVNSIGKCPLWSTDKPWDFARICGASKIGEGWGLVAGFGTTSIARIDVASGGAGAPTNSGQYSDAPVDCAGSDSQQYSRTYESALSWANPTAGPTCTPNGYMWVHIKAYAGTGNGYIDKTTGGVYDKTDLGKAVLTKSDGTMFVKGDVYPATITAGTLGSKHLVAGGTVTTAQASAIKTAYGKLLKDKTAIIFANDNGVAALSFQGLIIKNSDSSITLAADLPAFNDAGLKGFLPLDTDISDFRLVINNTAYLKAGDCTAGKYHVVTTHTYSPFPADYAANTTHYADKVVDYQGSCTN
jgi:hypothetical protein